MTDLVEFLRARLDEETESALIAKAVGRVIGWKYEDGSVSDYGDHGVVSTPDYVLAEVEAKRRIIDLAQAEMSIDRRKSRRQAAEAFLLLLAQPYADHEAFQPEWKL